MRALVCKVSSSSAPGPALWPHASVRLTACGPSLLPARRDLRKLEFGHLASVALHPQALRHDLSEHIEDCNQHCFGNFISSRELSRRLQVGADLVFEVGQALHSMAAVNSTTEDTVLVRERLRTCMLKLQRNVCCKRSADSSNPLGLFLQREAICRCLCSKRDALC